ncbi:hypothetical protein WR25_11937 [Diploscapter pachys]|uniref:Serine protease K12H4.7 n=1 Tax=Diploscapter pachys TaxID=2018661 RepID=A0A2A2LT99_9BILA|nr:hypothetical protein WR25_11937 [Diploscapter pachys]
MIALQRYWQGNQWYRPGGPAFIMLGGEAAEGGSWVEASNVEFGIMAQKAGAWLFVLEHRFYGESFATSDLSTGNLKYLSSEQAIADAVTFIRAMIQKYPQLAGAKWVSFGGSYPGALAAWLRIRHPEIISYAVGSSGPVQAEVDFYQYLEVVMNAITKTDAGCSDSIKNGFSQIAQLVQTAAGRKTLKSTFDFCEDLNPSNTEDLSTFWQNLYIPYMYSVQYTSQNPDTSIPNAICRFHNDQSASVLDRMKNVNSFFDQTYGYTSCMSNNYNGMIHYYQDTSLKSSLAETRSFIWQTCTEFGWFQTSNSPTAGSWLGGQNNLPASYFIKQCADIFKLDINADYVNQVVGNTNSYYGGKDMSDASYIILPSGTFDPWSALGKLTSTNQNIVPVVMEGASHCQDMIAATAQDSAALTSGRAKIQSTLLGWLGFSEN